MHLKSSRYSYEQQRVTERQKMYYLPFYLNCRVVFALAQYILSQGKFFTFTLGLTSRKFVMHAFELTHN